MEVAMEKYVRSLQLYKYSMLVINSMNRNNKLLDVHLKFLWEKKKDLVCNFDSIPFDHASRELNAEADRLSKRRHQVPEGRVLFEKF